MKMSELILLRTQYNEMGWLFRQTTDFYSFLKLKAENDIQPPKEIPSMHYPK